MKQMFRICSEMFRFLRFDIKSTRPTGIDLDKFALISEVWNRFIENCRRCFKPSNEKKIPETKFDNKTKHAVDIYY